MAGPNAVLSILRARERERRRCARISAITEHDEGNALLAPIVPTSCGGFGPSAQKYLKHIYGRARENSRSDMGVGQHAIQTTRSTLHHASMYWNMRLRVASAAKDAQVLSGISLSDFTRNHVVHFWGVNSTLVEVPSSTKRGTRPLQGAARAADQIAGLWTSSDCRGPGPGLRPLS